MWGMWLILVVVLLVVVAIHDRRQRTNTIIANFPIIGRFRQWFEALGGPLRQYIVTGNDEERPFTRDQRRWVYTSANLENNYFGFGTDNELENTQGYLIIRQSTFPISPPVSGMPGYDPKHRVPCAKVMGGYRGRKHAFRPESIINTSAMSYGSLSGAAVESINRGMAIAGGWQNTGEGGISPYHRHGGDLLWQLGTGYFGCRDAQGKFSMERFLEGVNSAPVRAIEIKLSQGAKPGLGGVLPAAKITPEISAIRHVPMGKDCISPASHSAFSDVSSMLDFIESLADATGLPVGIKAAVGQMGFWQDLAKQMETTGRAPDFISVDGGEGGTGAAPLVFSDHVSLPFKLGFTSVYRTMAERGMHEKVLFIGSGRLGFPQQVLLSMALGCDLVSVAREAMLSIGCIQAQECHTGKCPTGITSQKPWLMGGLDPMLKSARLANYIMTLRKESLALAHACGDEHPGVVSLDNFDIVDGFSTRPAREVFGYDAAWGLPEAHERDAIRELMRSLS